MGAVLTEPSLQKLFEPHTNLLKMNLSMFLLLSSPRTCSSAEGLLGAGPMPGPFLGLWKTAGSGVSVKPFLFFHPRKIPSLWELTRKILGNGGTEEQDSRISKMKILTVTWKALEVSMALWKTKGRTCMLCPCLTSSQRLGSASWCLAAVLGIWALLVVLLLLSKAVIS